MLAPLWNVGRYTCPLAGGMEASRALLHAASAACALVTAERAHIRQSQGVERVTVRCIADTDY